jgi:CRP-like cAMP-binding protein
LPANRLLASLLKKEYQSLRPELTAVTLAFGEMLYERGDTISHVYFPNTTVISLLSTVAERAPFEVGMVGNEGMAGLSVFMGIDKADTHGLVKGAGSAFRMKSATLRKITNHASSLHIIVHRYTYSLLSQISQSSACNRFHSADARLARWLSMTSDRMISNEVRLTQDFLSKLMAQGARQSVRLQVLFSAIAILNRPGLEQVSCNCYATVRESDNFRN